MLVIILSRLVVKSVLLTLVLWRKSDLGKLRLFLEYSTSFHVLLVLAYALTRVAWGTWNPV
uniref:Uncharacterized protein n=1 Tax=Solanum lycopersicum TaxID=4081 RepID=A0A3Q7I4T4_SOLLC